MASCTKCLYRDFQLNEEPCSECEVKNGQFSKYKPVQPKEWSDDTYYEIIEAVESRLRDEMNKVSSDGTHSSILAPGLMVASGIIIELHLRRIKRD